MRVLNFLPVFLECLRRWEKAPGLSEFALGYYSAVEDALRPMLEDWGVAGPAFLHSELMNLNWSVYREECLRLDAAREEARLKRAIDGVERVLGVRLGGEAVLFSAFTMMDGYARFDRGSHRVYLGVDESHGRGAYLDVLMAHELTHVARESRPEVWAPFGLSLDMSHDEFSERLPVVEHLFNEGFSCAVSELVAPCEEPWHYAYQTKDGLERILERGPAVDRVVHRELLSKDGDYGRLYRTSSYGSRMPDFCHYVWAWKWVKSLIEREGGGDPGRLLARSSHGFIEDALAFRLS